MATTDRAAADSLVARPSLRSLVDDLHERRTRAREGGGEERIARQHEQEKLTARERLALLIDEGTFVELGVHGRPHFSQRAMEGKEAAADGVVTGYGKIDGRLVAVAEDSELVGIEVTAFEAPGDPDELADAAETAMRVLDPVLDRIAANAQE